MKRMTKLQMDHLRQKIDQKVSSLVRELTESKAKRRLQGGMKGQPSAEQIMRKLKKSEIIRLYTNGGNYGFFNRLLQTPEAKALQEGNDELKNVVFQLDRKIRKKWDKLAREADAVYDQAMFAGSSEEVISLLNSFLEKQ